MYFIVFKKQLLILPVGTTVHHRHVIPLLVYAALSSSVPATLDMHFTLLQLQLHPIDEPWLLDSQNLSVQITILRSSEYRSRRPSLTTKPEFPNNLIVLNA